MVVFRARVKNWYDTVPPNVGNRATEIPTALVNSWLNSTEPGAWVQQHKTAEVRVEHMFEIYTMDLLVAAMAQMSPEDETFYRLKFGAVQQDITI